MKSIRLFIITVFFITASLSSVLADSDDTETADSDGCSDTDTGLNNSATSVTDPVIPRTGSKPISKETLKAIDDSFVQIEYLAANYNLIKNQADNSKGLLKRLFETRLDNNRQSLLDTSLSLLKKIRHLQERDFNISDYWLRATHIASGLVDIVSKSARMAMKHARETSSIQQSDTVDEQFSIDARLDSDAKRVDQMMRLVINNLSLLHYFGVNTEKAGTTIKHHLLEAAEMRSIFLEISADDLNQINTRLSITPDDPKLKTAQKQIRNRISVATDALSRTIAMMKMFNMNIERFKAQLVETTGDISEDILDASVLSVLLNSWSSEAVNWFNSNALNILFKILLFVFILIAFWVLSRIVRSIVQKILSNPGFHFTRLLRRMLIMLSQNAVLLAGLLIALSQMGLSIGPLLAGLGVAGFIMGFALQDTLSNFASGMMILIYRPFDVGDLLEAGGVYGFVNKMSLVNTTILTLDNQTLIVPNNKIWGDIIKNVTAQQIRRVDMTFGISYSDDIAKAEETLHSIIESCDMILENPEPVIHLHELGDSSVNFIVRPWSKTEDYWPVYWEITRKVKIEFDNNGISIPFPQQDVHIHTGSDEQI